METVNMDILIEILSHLPQQDKMQSTKVCKTWYDANKYIYQKQQPIEVVFNKINVNKFNEWGEKYNQLTFNILYNGDLVDLINKINVKKVVELNVTGNGYTTLPVELALFENLKVLHLGRNKLQTIPECVFELKNLTHLYIHCNRLETISPKISQLENLQVLEIDGNELQRLPESISELKNLKKMILSGNRINSLPESIGQMDNLEYIDLIMNDLSFLPDTIINMKKIQSIYLNLNPIQQLSKQFRGIVKVSRHENIDYY